MHFVLGAMREFGYKYGELMDEDDSLITMLMIERRVAADGE